MEKTKEEEIVHVSITDFSKFTDDMSSFYLNKAFSDVYLNLDGKKLPAHKIVLSARCNFFELLLLSNPNQSEIIITNVPTETFKKILKYIYTGNIKLNPLDIDVLFEILKLARAYSLNTLVTVICQETASVLNASNVSSILNISNTYDLDEMRQICHTFIDDRISEITERQPDFFNKLTQKSMVKLLERDFFPLPEIDIFKIVANWCKIHTDDDNLVVRCVRFSRLTRSEILNIVWPSKLIESDKLLSILASIEESSSAGSTVLPHGLQLYKKLYNDVSISLTSEEDELLRKIFQLPNGN